MATALAEKGLNVDGPKVTVTVHYTTEESQVLRHIVEYVGKGIDDDDEKEDDDGDDDEEKDNDDDDCDLRCDDDGHDDGHDDCDDDGHDDGHDD